MRLFVQTHFILLAFQCYCSVNSVLSTPPPFPLPRIAMNRENKNRAFRTIKHLRARSVEKISQENEIPIQIVELIKNLETQLTESHKEITLQNENIDQSIIMIANLQEQLTEITDEKEKRENQNVLKDQIKVDSRKNADLLQLIQNLR